MKSVGTIAKVAENVIADTKFVGKAMGEGNTGTNAIDAANEAGQYGVAELVKGDDPEKQ